MNNTTILQALWDDLCGPVLAAAAPQLSAAQQTALLYAPLIVVETDPVRVGVFGFGPDGPIDCGTSCELPRRAGAALARFFEGGINGPLETQLRPLALELLRERRAQLVVNLRPDRGEATCYLVTHGDQHPPVWLFTLTSEDSEVRH